MSTAHMPKPGDRVRMPGWPNEWKTVREARMVGGAPVVDFTDGLGCGGYWPLEIRDGDEPDPSAPPP